jgi:hypothetical protein
MLPGPGDVAIGILIQLERIPVSTTGKEEHNSSGSSASNREQVSKLETARRGAQQAKCYGLTKV